MGDTLENLQRVYSDMRKKLPFRSWVYFRTGYTQYFAFILAVANMFTITYYLVIESNTFFEPLFSNFSSYVIISSIIGIPLLTLVGFAHIRKSHAYASEAEIAHESHPYNYKLTPGIQKECMAPLLLELLKLGTKSISVQKLTEDESKKLEKLEQNLDLIAKGGSLPIPKRFDDL